MPQKDNQNNEKKHKKRLNLHKGVNKKTRSLMNDIYEISSDFRARDISYNVPKILMELKKDPDSRKDYSEIVYAFNVARDIAKQVLKLMSRVFIDEKGNRIHRFIDFKGNVLTIPQAERQFEELLNTHKIPYEYYDSVEGTFIPMTSFVLRESINQERLRKAAFATETVLEDMILTNDTIRITGKSAVESLSHVKETHQEYLIDGLTPKKSERNLWEKELTVKEETERINMVISELEKRKSDLIKEDLKSKGNKA
jgi:hypothetical protein